MSRTGLMIQFTFALVLSSLCLNAALAGSLDKYGSDQDGTAPPPVTTKQSAREKAINDAVRYIMQATKEDRAKLIEEYRKRAKLAVEKDRYDEAKFYTEVLKRAEN